MSFVLKFIFYVIFFLIIKRIFEILYKQFKRPKNVIVAPSEIPILGNIHLVACTTTSQGFHKVWNLVDQQSPVRVSYGPYDIFFVDSPEDIRKMVSTIKGNAYEYVPFNDGLFTIKGRKK